MSMLMPASLVPVRVSVHNSLATHDATVLMASFVWTGVAGCSVLCEVKWGVRTWSGREILMLTVWPDRLMLTQYWLSSTGAACMRPAKLTLARVAVDDPCVAEVVPRAQGGKGGLQRSQVNASCHALCCEQH